MHRSPLVPAVAALLAFVAVAGAAGALTSYREASQEAGLSFQLAGEVHDPGTFAWPALPEILGGGACWFDADGDGYEDLYLVNQRYNPKNPNTEGWAQRVEPRNALYLNDGDGSFTKAPAGSGAGSSAWGYGCSAADHDGDRDLDLFVTNFGMNELFENQGNGTFENVTAQAGVGGQGLCGFEHRCLSTSSAWADHDGDGDLDLYVGNYVDTDLEDFARGPTGHDGQVNQLYRNEGDGTFTDVAEEAGVQGNPTNFQGSKTLGVIWFDMDLDGDQDLYVANDEVPNDLYQNNGDGTFTEVSDESGLADDRGSMGIAVGDYDRDGLQDLFFTHYDGEDNGFYRNLGDGTFEDRSGEDDHATSFGDVGWGTGFLDHDLDGDLDLLMVNGHTEWSEVDYGQPTRLLEASHEPEAAQGDVTWTEVSQGVGLLDLDARVSRGAAFADADLDGDVEVLVGNNANATVQYLTDQGTPTNGWVSISLDQPGPNHRAIGARVAVTVDGITQATEVRSGESFLSKNSDRLLFGLGSHQAADTVQVTWPDGQVDTFEDVVADQVLRVDRATGELVNDTIAPRTSIHIEGSVGDNGWWTGPVEVSLRAQDRGVTAASGVESLQVGWTPASLAPYDGEPLQVEDPGRHHLSYQATDRAGNREPLTTQALKIDTTPPSVAVTLEGQAGTNGWWTSREVTVHLEGQDATSGVARLEVAYGDGPWTVYEEPGTLVGDGIHHVRARAIDAAGHMSDVMVETVAIDHIVPTALLTRPAAGHLHMGAHDVDLGHQGPAVVVTTEPALGQGGTFVIVEAVVEDGTSGVSTSVASVDGQALPPTSRSSGSSWSWDTGTSPGGTVDVVLRVTDQAGNQATDRVQVLLVPVHQAGLSSTVEAAEPTAATVRPPAEHGGFDRLLLPAVSRAHR